MRSAKPRDLMNATKAKCNVNDGDKARVVVLEKQVKDLVEDIYLRACKAARAQKWRQEAEMCAEEGFAKEEYIAEIQAEAGAQALTKECTTKDADLEL